MPTAQEWLDLNYPTKKKRENIKEVDLTNQNLIGDLDISDFDGGFDGTYFILNGNPNLGKIIDRKKNKTQITLNPKPPQISTQEYLERELNQSVRQSVKRLDLFKKALTDSADFSKFGNLEELCYSINNLTSLVIPSQLVRLSCHREKFLIELIILS